MCIRDRVYIVVSKKIYNNQSYIIKGLQMFNSIERILTSIMKTTWDNNLKSHNNWKVMENKC